MSLPSDQGTYILILHLSDPTILTIGKLGTFDFPTGWYAYVGSAFGTGGLRGRLKHHLAPVRKPHWHIDTLRTAAPVQEVWYVADQTVHEHEWADNLRSLPGAAIPAPRFGASDCNCVSHLVYFPQRPGFQTFADHSHISLMRWWLENDELDNHSTGS